MNDSREDQLLCPTHYRPVEAVTPRPGFTRYLCSHCPDVYEFHELVSANELSKLIEEADGLPLGEREVKDE